MNRFRRTDDTTTHPHDEERLSAYLDGELSPQERAAVKQHLAECLDCQWDLATLQQTVQWTRELPTVPVPSAFTIPVKVERGRAPRRGWSLLPVLQGATALVALLLFVTVAGDFWVNGFQFARAPMPRAVLQTVQVEAQATQVVEAVTEAPAELKAAAPEVAGAPEVEVTQGMAAAVAVPTPTAVPAPAEPPAAATEAAAATMAPAGTGVGGEAGETTAEAQADQTTRAAAQPPSETQPFVATVQAEPTAGMAAATSAVAGSAAAGTVTAEASAETLSAETSAAATTAAEGAPSAEGERAEPTVIAEAPAVPGVVGPEQEQARAAERYEPGLPWLRVAELGLAVALLLLIAATFLLALQRRKAR